MLSEYMKQEAEMWPLNGHKWNTQSLSRHEEGDEYKDHCVPINELEFIRVFTLLFSPNYLVVTLESGLRSKEGLRHLVMAEIKNF